MKEIFKPVPNIDDLIINQDGTVIYYQDKQIKITEVLVKKNG